MYIMCTDDNNTTVPTRDYAPMRDEWLAMPCHHSALCPAGCSKMFKISKQIGQSTMYDIV